MGPLPSHVLGAAPLTSNNAVRHQGCWDRSQAAATLPSPFTSSEDCAEAAQLGATLSQEEEISASATTGTPPHPGLGSLLSEQPGDRGTR